jgi:DNA polymerase-1
MRLLLVDGHYYLYRSFFAIRGLQNSRGEPTNAIFGFIKALRKMLADIRPDRAAVIWDCGLPARRVELQPAYKQNRSEMPDDLRPQEDWLQEKIPLLGTASLFVENTEADDLIASYAVAARREGAEVVIATNDKDILQLVDESTRIYSTAKADLGDGTFALLGPVEVASKWGVPAARIADVLALTGDQRTRFRLSDSGKPDADFEHQGPGKNRNPSANCGFESRNGPSRRPSGFAGSVEEFGNPSTVG